MIKCFFHSADLDGHCSGAIVKYKFPQCELFGINYDYNFPWDKVTKDDIVFIVDFSLPAETMKKLYDFIGDNLIWIDHHVSIIDKISNDYPEMNIPGVRKVGTAACILTWEYLFPKKELPRSVLLLGKYDIWDLTDEVLEFQYGIRAIGDTWPKNQELWKKLFEYNDYITYVIENCGRVILDYQNKQDEIYCKAFSFEMEFEGYKAITINRRLTSSRLFNSVWDENKYDIMITFGMKKNGMWEVSFYTTKKEIDVSKLAQKFGGGGHRSAAGCGFKELPQTFFKTFKELQEKYK
jgi:oligoribonuclease NrnB/cAMP/cGMP phosphodiesterase (DHH superfamily)